MDKWCFLRNSNNRRTVKSILLVKKFLGLVEMTSGLVNASFSLPEWQTVKMIFFAPWIIYFLCWHRRNLFLAITVCDAAIRSLKPDWQIDNGFLNRPIIAPTVYTVLKSWYTPGRGSEQWFQSWLPHGLNRRFSFICGAGSLPRRHF